MFESLVITEHIPRDLSLIKNHIHNGLGMQKFFALFFLIAGIIVSCNIYYILRNVFQMLPMLLFAAIGYYMLTLNNRKVTQRQQCFEKGEIVIAKVVDHKRKSNWFKSTRDYALKVQIDNNADTHTIINKNKEIWLLAPEQTDIIGLTYDGHYLFGEEIGMQFRTVDE